MSKSAAQENPAPVKDKPIVVTLEEPILRAQGEPITELTLRKPQGGERRGFSMQDFIRVDVGAILDVLPRIATPFIIAEQADQLCTEDLAQIGGAISSFFMSSAQKAAIMKQLGMEESTD